MLRLREILGYFASVSLEFSEEKAREAAAVDFITNYVQIDMLCGSYWKVVLHSSAALQSFESIFIYYVAVEFAYEYDEAKSGTESQKRCLVWKLFEFL